MAVSIKLELKPQRRQAPPWIVCYFCGAPAVRIHLLSDEVLPSCGDCDPGGCWLPLREFAQRPLEWLGELLQANPSQALALLRWAGSNIPALERVARGEDVGMTRETVLEWLGRR